MLQHIISVNQRVGGDILEKFLQEKILKSLRRPQKIKNGKKEFDLVELFISYATPWHPQTSVLQSTSTRKQKYYTSEPKKGRRSVPKLSNHSSSRCRYPNNLSHFPTVRRISNNRYILIIAGTACKALTTLVICLAHRNTCRC